MPSRWIYKGWGWYRTTHKEAGKIYLKPGQNDIARTGTFQYHNHRVGTFSARKSRGEDFFVHDYHGVYSFFRLHKSRGAEFFVWEIAGCSVFLLKNIMGRWDFLFHKITGRIKFLSPENQGWPAPFLINFANSITLRFYYLSYLTGKCAFTLQCTPGVHRDVCQALIRNEKELDVRLCRSRSCRITVVSYHEMQSK